MDDLISKPAARLPARSRTARRSRYFALWGRLFGLRLGSAAIFLLLLIAAAVWWWAEPAQGSEEISQSALIGFRLAFRPAKV